MRIAAIDQGTTSTRVLLLEGGNAPRVLCAHRHTTTHPKPGWVEQDALELLANVRLCLDAAGSVDAVGLDNQGETCLAWDAETGEPVGPAIVWQDARTGDRLEAMKADGHETVVLERAGLPLDPYFSASKLAWILENRPEAAALHAAGRLRLGTTDAFFLQHLTGRCVTDVTTASRTSLMALDTGNWCPELCRLFGVPIETLPEIVPTVGDFGACAQGPVLAAVVDQQAALYGHGCRRPGDAKITFGTGAFVLAVTGDAPLRVPDAGLLPTVAWDIGGITSYAVDGGVYNAGSAVEWLQGLGLIKDVTELAAFDRAPAIDRDLVFVPALSGLACPHWDRLAAGMWLGLSLGTDAADMAQALLEGIALRTAQVVAAIDRAVPIGDTVSIDGGLVRSPYFTQFLADALGRTVSVPAFDEQTSYGTAMLAAAGLGAEPDDDTGAPRLVAPRGDGQAWRDRFDEAVGRARSWRRSDV